MDSNKSDRYEEFLEVFWRDVGVGRRRSLAAYQARFPGLEREIAEEHAAGTLAATPTASTPKEDAGEPDTEAGPARIGRYEILDRLAEGGMGSLLLGMDRELGSKVVLKTVRNLDALSDERVLERLKREAKIGRRLAHDGICPVFDVLTAHERVFVVMPFLEGESLGAKLRRIPPTSDAKRDARAFWETLSQTANDHADPQGSKGTSETRISGGDLGIVLRLLERIARALHLAHEAGVVHRDLKPDNILIRPYGDPVILDFGLAVDLTGAAGTRLSQEGDVLGTPAYMAPEQIQGRVQDIDWRTDLYALGVLLYELITLRPPFTGSSMRELFASVVQGDPKPPRRHNPAISRDLEAVCMAAMERDPARRPYGSVLAFAQDLRRVRKGDPTIVRPTNVAQRLARRVRRKPWTTGIFAAGALAAIVALVLGSRFARAARIEAYLSGLAAKEPERRNAARQWVLANVADHRLQQLLLDPTNAPIVNEVVRVLSEHRGGRDQGLQLLSPRGSLVAPRPRFRFRVGPESERRFELRLRDESGRTRRFAVAAPEPASDEWTFSLPPTETLARGRYQWLVRAVDEPDEAVPAALEFRIVSKDEVADLLSRAATTGHAGFDAWLQISLLLEQRLGTMALRRLRSLPAELTRPDAARWRPLWALAHALVGDRESAERELAALFDQKR